jgi:hypothetical protein
MAWDSKPRGGEQTMRQNKRKPPFVHPFYQIKRETAQSPSFPVLMPDSFPLPFRKFCCLVVVEGKSNFWCGAGTLTDMGILTARHLFVHNTKITDKWASFLLEGSDWVTIDLGEILLEDAANDIIIVSHPVLSSYFTPVKIGWLLKDLLFVPDNLWAFGCPLGLLGKVWRPRFVGISEGKIYTKGFACPGVSGGGIFTRKGNEWYVWAVHSELYLQGWTLLSSLVNLEIR